jgi:hypothetical protein
MQELIYFVDSRREAQFVGRRLDRSFLPQVLEKLCFFILESGQVYVAVGLSEHTTPPLQRWACRILSECGVRCDDGLTLAQLTEQRARFSEVFLDRGSAFLAEET